MCSQEPEACPLAKSKSKSMRQLQFESDSSSSHSNHDVVDSPSSFLSEPGRGVDCSLPKPTVSRPVEVTVDDDEEGVQFVAEIRSQPDSGTPHELLGKSPCRDPDSQTHRLVECLDTQQLLPNSIRSSGDSGSNKPELGEEIPLTLSVVTLFCPF